MIPSSIEAPTLATSTSPPGAAVDSGIEFERRALRARRHYHTLLKRHYAFLIPPGARVLEVGCGLGDLLAELQPECGVGIDRCGATVEQARRRHPGLEFIQSDALAFESPPERFDHIILSDLVNDLQDVQAVLEKLRDCATPETRLTLNFFNTLWRPILAAAEWAGWKTPSPPQNWLSSEDVQNLLHLAGWEVIKVGSRILWPLKTPVLAGFLNRWMAPLLHHLCLTIFIVARPKPAGVPRREFKCSVVIPARNEAGNVEAAVLRLPELGAGTEIIFVEGHSRDNSWEVVSALPGKYPTRDIKVLKQQSRGKGGAVREGFDRATGDILFVLDADLTVQPEELTKFYEAIRSGTAEFVNGVRLVYPMEHEAMRFLNMVANKFFGAAFSWLLGLPIKDTLCGTKVLSRAHYRMIAQNRGYFGEFDPFGDFELLFGAAKLNLKIVDLPIRYQARSYGETNIQRWRHGWLLLRMTFFAARRLKFME